MSSFVDKFRSTPRTTRTVVVFGGDPDMDTTGFAAISAEITIPATAKPRVLGACIGLIVPARGHLRELEQADEMVRAIMTFSDPHLNACAFHAAFIEAQQVYPNPDEDPRLKVAKANDLLRCAQVTGALQAWAVGQGIPVVRSLLPATWKGQTDKNVTLAEMQARMPDATVSVQAEYRGKPIQSIMGRDLNLLPAKLNHAIDALGIATYGLDLLSRHLELIPPMAP